MCEAIEKLQKEACEDMCLGFLEEGKLTMKDVCEKLNKTPDEIQALLDERRKSKEP